MKKILSVGGLVAALILTFLPFIAGADFGISIPSLADPNGVTTLSSGITLHTSWTHAGHVCMLLGSITSAGMALLAMSAFSAE